MQRILRLRFDMQRGEGSLLGEWVDTRRHVLDDKLRTVTPRSIVPIVTAAQKPVPLEAISASLGEALQSLPEPRRINRREVALHVDVPTAGQAHRAGVVAQAPAHHQLLVEPPVEA